MLDGVGAILGIAENANAFLQFANHPPLRLCPKNAMVRQEDVAEEVDALAMLADRDFARMEFKTEMSTEK